MDTKIAHLYLNNNPQKLKVCLNDIKVSFPCAIGNGTGKRYFCVQKRGLLGMGTVCLGAMAGVSVSD